MHRRTLFTAFAACLLSSYAFAQQKPPTNVARFLEARQKWFSTLDDLHRGIFDKYGLLPSETKDLGLSLSGSQSEDTEATLQARRSGLNLVPPEERIAALQDNLLKNNQLLQSDGLSKKDANEIRAKSTLIRLELRKLSGAKDAENAAYQARINERKAMFEPQIAEYRKNYVFRPSLIDIALGQGLKARDIGYFEDFPSGNGYWPNIQVRQIIGPKVALVVHKSPHSAKTSELFVLRGVDTAEWTDDAGVRVSDCFEVVGTTTYDTVSGGTNTVFVLEPFDVEAALKYASER